MGLRDVLAAKARGDIPTKDLIAYGRAGSDAYDLLDQLSASGYPRLCAWNAFVLQTYGDKLLAAVQTPGFAPPETAEQVATLYQFVGGWIARARQAAADPGYRLDVYVPQALPHHWQTAPRTTEQLTGMRDAFQAAQATLVSELGASAGDDGAGARLKALGLGIDSVAEYLDKLWTHEPGPELRATLGATLTDGLNRAYQLGQVLAVPDLLEELHAQPAPPQRSGPQLRLPGEAGFDPWCLTDPLERRRMADDGDYRRHIDAMWRADPYPERTLAIRAEIDAALTSGAVDYLPLDGVGQLALLADRCPWPGVLYVKSSALIGGQELEPGERFVFTVSHDDGSFQRSVVVVPATDDLPISADAPTDEQLAVAELVALFGRRPGYRRYGL
jgi:hypothetical protein